MVDIPVAVAAVGSLALVAIVAAMTYLAFAGPTPDLDESAGSLDEDAAATTD